MKKILVPIILLCLSVWLLSLEEAKTREEKLLASMHEISSHTLLAYVAELSSPLYAGRLTGTPGYDRACEWVAAKLRGWGLRSGGENSSYFQTYPNPYTVVKNDGELTLDLTGSDGIRKRYQYESEYFPGSTSGSGRASAEVVYVGYGITAPELGYDDYRGVDARGKIVLMEREVPVSPDKDAALFARWRPYSFHQYKTENARRHGVAGILYNYGPISNPNNEYIEGMLFTHVGDAVVADLFSGSGRDHKRIVEQIERSLRPRSFATGKRVTMANSTEHHPEGVGRNVSGVIEGSDPALRDQVLILCAHLDHNGSGPRLFPGANDNASGVAILLGVAEALARSSLRPQRSVAFLFTGSEEQAIKGAAFYLDHPLFPLAKTVGLLNLDGVGCGGNLEVLAGKNFPALWEAVRQANEKYIHRPLEAFDFHNRARPRLDAALFMARGVHSLSFSVSGAPYYYHTTRDDASSITPEILEDLSQLLFVAVLDLTE